MIKGDVTVNDKQDHANTIFIPVDFILHPENQRLLIHILKTYSSLSLIDLSRMIHIPEQTLSSVLEKKCFLRETDAKKLARYFCLFCGS